MCNECNGAPPLGKMLIRGCRNRCRLQKSANARMRARREILNAVTYIDVLSEQFIGHSVLVEDVEIDSGTGDGGSKEEAEHSRRAQISLTSFSLKESPDVKRVSIGATYPPRKAPMGCRKGSAAEGVSSKRLAV